MARLQLDEQQRQAVDEADEIGPLGVELACEPDLRGEEGLIPLRALPIDDADEFRLARPVRVAHVHRDALAQQIMNFGIGADGVDRSALPREDRKGVIERFLGDAGVEALQGEPQAVGQDGVAFRRASFSAGASAELAEQIAGCPAKLGKQFDRWLLDEIGFREAAITGRSLLRDEVVGTSHPLIFVNSAPLAGPPATGNP